VARCINPAKRTIEVVEKNQTIDSWLDIHATHQGGKPALNFEGHSHSYSALAGWVTRIAAGMQQRLGLKRGDRIAYLGKNSDSEVALIFAAARLGLILVPLNWRLAAAELHYVMQDSGAKYLFHDAHFADQIAPVLDGLADVSAIDVSGKLDSLTTDQTLISPGATLADPLFIVYTSGTTGRPKGAVLTQEAVLWNAVISLHAHDFTPEDHILNILPLFHVGGINIQMMPTFFVGGQVTLHAQFDPTTTIEALENAGITTTVCVPTVMRALLYHPDWGGLGLPKLRLINTGSTDVPVEILDAVHKRGIPMVQVYGATETGPIATYQKAGEAVSTAGSIGRVAAHSQVKLMGDDGEVGLNTPGEIWVKGPNNFSHYWNNPAATEAALVDGWFRTGDVAYQDKDGLFWFADRIKHVIISGGENIYPAELERVLNRLPGIREAAVVGRAHPKWGEVPVAAVVVNADGPDKAQVLVAFSDEIARFKHPKDVVFLDRLPRNAMGKILAGEVRKLVAATQD
jgi:fatty-acyl-CoA synthase